MARTFKDPWSKPISRETEEHVNEEKMEADLEMLEKVALHSQSVSEVVLRLIKKLIRESKLQA